MASYKVPQDVEADDKLLGPFSFRQFIYLMIVFGMVVLAVALFQIFPLLAAIPIPFALFFLILALPLKKDQPMETYVAALISFYLRPNRRFWIPGQSDSTIQITAPKKIEKSRVRNISEEEAGHRLSFLAAIVDSEGYAIKNASSPMRDEFYAEAYNATDMFDRSGTTVSAVLSPKSSKNATPKSSTKCAPLSPAPTTIPIALFLDPNLSLTNASSSPSVLILPPHPPSFNLLLPLKSNKCKTLPTIPTFLLKPSVNKPIASTKKTIKKLLYHYIKESNEPTKHQQHPPRPTHSRRLW